MGDKPASKDEQVTIFREMSEIFSSSFDLSSRLSRVLELAMEMMRMDACIIYLLDEWGDKLILTAFQGSCTPCNLGDLHSLENGVPAWIVKEKETVNIEDLDSDSRVYPGPGFPPGKFRSCLGMPVMDGHLCLGVIVVQREEKHKFSRKEIDLLNVITKQAAGIIRNSLVYSKARRILGNLSALYRLGNALNSTLNLQELLHIIADYSAEVTKACGCILRLLTETGHSLKIKAISKIDPGMVNKEDVMLGHDIAGLVARLGEPILVKDVNIDSRFINVSGVVERNLLCVPIKMRNEIIGTIEVFDKDSMDSNSSFDNNDLELLITLSNHAVVALDNARLYQKTRRLAESNITKVNKLMILNEISTALRQTIDLKRRVKIILSGVTLGAGFGFNRAMILLANEDKQVLKGIMGIGPSSPDEAARIWQWFEKMDRPLSQWLIDQSSELDIQDQFNELAKSLEIPVRPGENVFTESIIQMKTFNITDASRDPLVPHDIFRQFQTNAFAVIPLLAKDKVFGVLQVDNLYNQKPILQEDLTFLEMLANHAALSIDSAQTYSKLEQTNKELMRTQDLLVKSERLAAVGQLAASIVHEIRNPLVPIGGFARRLKKLVHDEQGVKYTNIIIQEVKRLEKFLDEVLSFSRELELKLAKVDLNDVLEETIFMFQELIADRDIKLEQHLDLDLPQIVADRDQLKQVFLNILTNASEAIKKSGTINIKTCLSPNKDNKILIEISDTGPGIPEQIKHEIFDPFFTTKPLGTGLGLSLSNKIIAKHGGILEMSNQPDGPGARVLIKVPINIE